MYEPESKLSYHQKFQYLYSRFDWWNFFDYWKIHQLTHWSWLINFHQLPSTKMRRIRQWSRHLTFQSHFDPFFIHHASRENERQAPKANGTFGSPFIILALTRNDTVRLRDTAIFSTTQNEGTKWKIHDFSFLMGCSDPFIMINRAPYFIYIARAFPRPGKTAGKFFGGIILWVKRY